MLFNRRHVVLVRGLMALALVAGNNNVPVSVTGTFSSASLTVGQVQMGPTNLPGNQAELLSGSGTKQ